MVRAQRVDLNIHWGLSFLVSLISKVFGKLGLDRSNEELVYILSGQINAVKIKYYLKNIVGVREKKMIRCFDRPIATNHYTYKNNVKFE